jgi:CheY-like chemotaxis protein
MPDPASLVVLVVEDEEMLRVMVERMLALGGHRVILCPSGAAALDLVARDAVAFDVLLCDVHLDRTDRLDGLDVATGICRARPGTPVVLTSGEPVGSAMERLPAACSARFIAKPYARGELLATIEEAWRAAQPAVRGPGAGPS